MKAQNELTGDPQSESNMQESNMQGDLNKLNTQSELNMIALVNLSGTPVLRSPGKPYLMAARGLSNELERLRELVLPLNKAIASVGPLEVLPLSEQFLPLADLLGAFLREEKEAAPASRQVDLADQLSGTPVPGTPAQFTADSRSWLSEYLKEEQAALRGGELRRKKENSSPPILPELRPGQQRPAIENLLEKIMSSARGDSVSFVCLREKTLEKKSEPQEASRSQTLRGWQTRGDALQQAGGNPVPKDPLSGPTTRLKELLQDLKKTLEGKPATEESAGHEKVKRAHEEINWPEKIVKLKEIVKDLQVGALSSLGSIEASQGQPLSGLPVSGAPVLPVPGGKPVPGTPVPGTPVPGTPVPGTPVPVRQITGSLRELTNAGSMRRLSSMSRQCLDKMIQTSTAQEGEDQEGENKEEGRLNDKGRVDAKGQTTFIEQSERGRKKTQTLPATTIISKILEAAAAGVATSFQQPREEAVLSRVVNDSAGVKGSVKLKESAVAARRAKEEAGADKSNFSFGVMPGSGRLAGRNVLPGLEGLEGEPDKTLSQYIEAQLSKKIQGPVIPKEVLDRINAHYQVRLSPSGLQGQGGPSDKQSHDIHRLQFRAEKRGEKTADVQNLSGQDLFPSTISPAVSISSPDRFSPSLMPANLDKLAEQWWTDNMNMLHMDMLPMNTLPMNTLPMNTLHRGVLGERNPVSGIKEEISTSALKSPSSPQVSNTFNIQVYPEELKSGGDIDTLAEKINKILVDQARRYGIEVK